jgi:MoxR-like ATPase
MAAAGLERAQDVADRIVANVERVVLGKTEQIRLVLAGLACRGHVLLEDVPGTAKTVLARALTQSIEGAVHARIQCTPDLQPTDVTGLSIYDQRTREFAFRPGPVFANVVLVDEINRAMPKTQSALLEAMAERQVTVDGETRTLPDPFLVIATENPLEYEGTFPLPEAQLDRFFLRTSLGYPGTTNEVQILRDQRRGHPLERLEPAVTLDDLHALQDAVADVYMDELVELWIVRLVESTRTLEEVAVGASVRGTIALAHTARAWALLHRREYVVPADVEQLFLPVLGHRLLVEPSVLAESDELEPGDLLDSIRDRCFALAPPPDATEIRPAATAAAPAAAG